MMRTLAILALATLAAPAFAWTQVSEGHIDLGLGYDAGVWDPHIHIHDTEEEFEPTEAYLFYGPASAATRPAGSAYDFIGVGAGAPIWRNYQSNVSSIPWLGFGFEEIAPGTFDSFTNTDQRRDPISAEWVEVQFLSFTGPGHVSFFQGSGSSPTEWFASANGIDATDKFISTVGGHEHGSFVFTQTGIYELTFKASAVLNGQRIYSDEYTYYFGVQTAVPEPATMVTLGGAALLALRRRRKA